MNSGINMKAETFHQRLKRLRLAERLSAIEAAQAIGISSSTYREWENGRGIRGEPYEKIAEVFKVSLVELMLGEKAIRNKAFEELGEIKRHLSRLEEELYKTL